MSNLISIIIQAKDDASGVLKGVSGTLDSVGDTAIKVGVGLAALTAPIAGFLGTSLKQASDQQAALSQLSAVIKSTGGVAGVTADQADRLSQSLAGVTRFSDDSILSAENMLLTFTSIGKDIFPQVTQVTLDLSQALGQDLKSSAIQLGKALNDPITGLTALRRVGVQFTDQQKNQIEALQKSGDLLGAQKIILAELAREFGGSAVAAGKTFAGSIDVLNHKVQEFQESIGFILMPIIQRATTVIGGVIDRVVAWANKNPELTRTIVLISAALVTLGPALIAIGTALKLVSSAMAALSDFDLIGKAIAFLTNPIGLVIAALGALALAYSTNFLGIKDTLAPVVKTLGEGFATIGRDIGLFVDRLKEGGISEALGGLFSKFEDGSSTIKELLESFGVLPSTAETIATAISNAFNTIAPAIKVIQDSVEYFVKGFVVNVDDLLFKAGYYFGLIRGVITSAFDKIWDVIKPAVQPILDWFTGSGNDSLTGAVSGIPAWITQNIVDPLKGIWVIVQPYVQDIIDWFKNDFLNTVTQVAGWINTNIVTPLENLWTQLQPVLTNVANFIKGIFQPILDFINDILSRAADTFEILKRLGDPNYKPQRTLTSLGETSPGVVGDTHNIGGAPGKPQKSYGTSGGLIGPPVSATAQGYNYGTGILPSTFTGSKLPAVSGTAALLLGNPVFHDFKGPYQANTPYLVGRGAQPEVFIPSSSGVAVPNADRLGGGGRRFTWNGDLNVPPNSSINVNREQVYSWMDSWAEEVGIYG